MNFQSVCTVGAILQLQVRKVGTDELVRETAKFPNLVLDAGLDRMGVGTWIDRCVVGTGNAVPKPSDTALQYFLAETTNRPITRGSIQAVDAPYYYSGTSTWRFPVGTATGNISEVGLGWTRTTLWNRALVKDSDGNPTTITVLEDEYLDVMVEIRVYLKESTGSVNVVDKVGSVISTHTWKALPYLFNISNSIEWVTSKVSFGGYSDGISLSDQALPPEPTKLPTGGTSTYMAAQSSAIDKGIKVVLYLPSNEANFSHRTFWACLNGCMQSTGWAARGCGYKLEITPPLPKNNEQILTYNFSIKFSNHE